MSLSRFSIFTGTANPMLAEAVAKNLKMRLGKIHVSKFSDGETRVEILENVRGQNTFILQPTCAPTNDNLMEVLIMADALKRASVINITAVIPYFGYSRQDRRVRSSRVPISAKVVADLLSTVGISRIITVDLHADQIQGFFSIPVDNVYATPVMLADMHKKSFKRPMVVSPDVGGVVRARAFAKRLGTDMAIIDKRRPNPNESQIMHIIGDVQGHDCIIVDDIVDTGGTLCQAAKAMKDQGANSVTAYCTHPVLSGKALENISDSTLDELVVTDTIPLSTAVQKVSRIRALSLSEMLAETIYRVNHQESVSSMFLD